MDHGLKGRDLPGRGGALYDREGPISGRSGPILEACDQVTEGWGDGIDEALRGGGGSAAGPF